jgi:ribonuclease G
MAKEICISSTPHETRLAILEDDQLAEIYYERENEYTLAGSIYNGRVTRVLPGMQSAFVDIGLERDAFLYVTDFMELEDPEETDEIEKAATSPGGQQVREVRADRSQEKNGGRGGQQQRSEAKPEQKQEPKQDQRQGRERRPAVLEAGGVIQAPTESSYVVEPAEGAEQESGEPGAKRWRGRRRRRGGRGQSDSGESQSQSQSEQQPTSYVVESDESPYEQQPAYETESEIESEVAPEIYAGASSPAPVQSTPVPFVLPGESLSKYGGAPAASGSAPAVAAQPRPQSSYKPATLIDSPIEWDGSGLLPGESLSRHRNRPAEPVVEQQPEPIAQPSVEVHAEPRGVFVDSPNAFFEEIQESEELKLETAAENAVEAIEAHGAIAHQLEEEVQEELLIEETTKSSDGPADEAETYAEAHSAPVEAPAGEPALAVSETVASEDGTAEQPEPDAEASHHVDPLPPSGFRFFGLGGKKKKEEEPAAEKPKAAAVASVSAYAPGSGHLEEEVIDEEESYAPARAHHGKSDLHDNEDFEEETLPRQMRTGDLGELFQEAHLDHRIQLNFDGDGDEGEEEESAPAAGQPATGDGQQRRDRNGRNRRGGRSGARESGQRDSGQPAQAGGPGKGRGAARRSAQMSDLPIISDLLKPGQEILVQIAKEPIAQKGARITSHIALPGRFLVFMPTVTHIGVSRKIASDEERHRLKRILVHERGEASGGFIVRTAAEGASEDELRADLRFLIHLWNEIKTRSDDSKSPALIYHDLSLIERILRDQVSTNFSSIWVDSEANYERIVRFLNRFSPDLVRRVKLYTKETPLFEHFGIQDEIAKALRSKVWLKSGGSIVINQTEALVAIDINTGKYVGKSARLEDTIVKTNLDAVPEIVRQIRLRDLGGIIVIDFIDMDDRKNRFKVLAALEEALKSDKAPTKVLQFNDFGLVAITRKRVKQSLERTLSVPCPTCQATGMVKSPTTVCNEIYTELRKMKKHFEGADVLLRVNPETVKTLKSNNASWLTEFEELIGKNILIKSDPALHPEQFDIQG